MGLVSTYQTTDGATHAAADVWFATDRVAGVAGLQCQVSSLVGAMAEFGAEQDAAAAVMPSGSSAAASTTAPVANMLASNVGLMVDALGRFNSAPVQQLIQPVGLAAPSSGTATVGIPGQANTGQSGILVVGGK